MKIVTNTCVLKQNYDRTVALTKIICQWAWYQSLLMYIHNLLSKTEFSCAVCKIIFCSDSMARDNLNKREVFLTNTTAASKYVHT